MLAIPDSASDQCSDPEVTDIIAVPELKAFDPALLTGDNRAWTAFVRNWAGLIHGVIRRRLLLVGSENNEVAEDILQNVFVRLCQHDFALLRYFDPQRARFSTFLAVIATSTSLDYLRRQRRWARTSTALGGAALLDEATINELNASNANINTTTPDTTPPKGLLSPRETMVMILLYDREFSTVEAAYNMNVQVQTVRSLHHKAMLKLRRYFQNTA